MTMRRLVVVFGLWIAAAYMSAFDPVVAGVMALCGTGLFAYEVMR